ncbi:MAG TPA: hypothetical protein VI997_12135, partial [Candidatus Thermoplasmatota archaeon]|nr:hypothetical protein [Candidatus Thermoplasmatota archaeon]
LIAVASVTGCFGPSPSEASGAAGAGASTGPGPGEGSGFVLDAPDLPLGRAWTYAADVIYDPDPELTVVVARKDAAGYLFAAAAEDDLYGEAVWGREWYGPMTTDLLDAETPKWPVFDFPLHEGKTWAFSPRLNVTAHEADIALPDGGTERGFRIEGDDGRSSFSGEYAPSVGWFTTYAYAWSAGSYSLSLVGVEETDMYVWFERGPRVGVASGEGNPPGTATLDVPAGFDAVVASVGGEGGARTVVAPPPLGGAAWSDEFTGEETWDARAFPATPGTWALAAQAPPDAWGYTAVTAVTWLHERVG